MAAQCGWPLSASSQHHTNLRLSPTSPSPPHPPPPPPPSSSSSCAVSSLIHRLAADSAVVVFSVSTCCMCHVVKQLLGGLGVNLTVYEVDELVGGRAAAEAEAQLLLGALAEILGNGGAAAAPVPAVFVGGKLVGGLDHVMAAHISGALVPLLKQAGALWL